MNQGARLHIFRLISANTLQIFFSQAGAFVLFWLASTELSKQEFGGFNWFFAVYGTLTAIFSFGLDFIVIRRISAFNDINAARLQFTLTLFLSFLSLPAFFSAFSSGASETFRNSVFILVAFQCTFLGMPFKNALTGRELFTRSAAAVVISNLIKMLAMLTLWFSKNLTIQTTALTLAISNFFELVIYARNAWPVFNHRLLPMSFKAKEYREILSESLPQLGVIVFDSAFARVDWILMGALSKGDANLNTAEYTFAYKIFEVSRLPLLILAPILFTRFSKLFHGSEAPNQATQKGAHTFFALGLTAGLLVPLVLNFTWTPMMQFFTGGKYGPDNRYVYFILSASLPFLYMINFLWTMAFSQGQLRLTMVLSLINSCLNLLLNLLLIPRFGQTGAAISWLSCNLVIAPLYFVFVRRQHINFPITLFLKIISVAAVCSLVVWFLPVPEFIQAVLAACLFLGTTFFLKILTFADVYSLKFFLKEN